MLLIPLSTNRLYTHEIKPPRLPVEKMPTRMGYVIRCSDRRAKHDAAVAGGITWIEDAASDGGWAPMEVMTEDDNRALKELYFRENASSQAVSYPTSRFSMNQGDYLPPRLVPHRM